ncbi:MAG: type II toxin-antitoxin system VapB family antitoxin [Candidatus Omnitrophica bacterium]|nr:type II toxin-antitoxin system VapB family antitoxin [Candidatus Omnitrophota bacterium]
MSRTNVDLDDGLLHHALTLTHLPTKKAVVNLALTELVKRLKRRDIIKFMGSGAWEGDLHHLRGARV